MAELKYLDLSGLEIYDNKIKSKISEDDAATLQAAKNYSDGLSTNYDAAGTAQSLVSFLENGQVAANKTNIESLKTSVGTLGDLDTTAKTDLVSAVNEVLQAIEVGGTGSVVTIEKDVSGLIYTIKQGTSVVGTINIPKDMVVSSGVVEVNPSGQAPGTYLVLTLANATEDKVYVNVGKLVDVYTAKASAAQVQIVIDSETREISATIVAGSIGNSELASNSVTTVKIVDANVTKSKLESSVQTSLNKADTAIQNIAEGSINGTIAVDGKDVNVHGLGTAAYSATTAFDSAGTASRLVSALKSGAVAKNTSNITNLTSRVSSLESNKYTAITEAEISDLFA